MNGATREPPLLEMIGRLIDLAGSAGFPRAIADFGLRITRFESAFLCVFFTDRKPLRIYSNLSEEQERRTAIPYLSHAYLLDPFYALFKRWTGDRVVTLAECSPSGFRFSDYYRMFYADTDLLDECGVLISLEPGASILISLGSRCESIQAAARAKATLEQALPVIAPLCRHHWAGLKPTMMEGTGGHRNHLEQSFEMFGTSLLSAREAEIVRMILKGHSSKSMARILGSSPETVKVHRKRIYAKMNIGSQGELFSIFLQALARKPPESQEDPLVYAPGMRR